MRSVIVLIRRGYGTFRDGNPGKCRKMSRTVAQRFLVQGVPCFRIFYVLSGDFVSFDGAAIQTWGCVPHHIFPEPAEHGHEALEWEALAHNSTGHSSKV